MGQNKQVEIRVVELLASRLCHELVGPAGAVANGVEFLGELAPGEPNDDAMALVSKSADQIVSRLKFFRLAYGSAGRGSDDVPELRSVTHAFVESGNTRLDWPLPPIVPDLGDGCGKLVLNMVILAHEALIRGGTLSVSVDDDMLTVTSTGDDAMLPGEVVAALQGTAQTGMLTARAVQGEWTRLMSEQAGYSLELTIETGKVSLVARAGG